MFNPRADKRNCIRSFTMRDDSGKTFNDYGTPDLLHIVMIYLPNPKDDVKEDSFLAFVAELFAKHKASETSKWKSLIDRTEVSKLMEEMNTLSYQIFENGKEEGEILGVLRMCKKLNYSTEQAMHSVIEDYHLTKAEAEQYVKQYY